MLINVKISGCHRIKLWNRFGSYIIERDGRMIRSFSRENDAIDFFKKVC